MVGLRAMAAADARRANRDGYYNNTYKEGDDGAESSMRRARPPPPAREHPAAVGVAAGMKVTRRKRMARRMGEVQRVSEPPSVEKTDKVRAMDCYDAHEEDGAGSATRRALPPPPAREHPAVETVTAGMKVTRRKRTARRTGEVQRVSEPTGVGKTEEVRAMDCRNAHAEDGATRRAMPPPPAGREQRGAEGEAAEKGGKRKREAEAQRVEERMEEVREEPQEKRRARKTRFLAI